MTRLTGDWLTAAPTQAIFDLLETNGSCLYFVGGCVRNALLKRPIHDIDLATNILPDDIMQRAAAAGIKAIPTGIEHGTVTLVVDDVPHEITTFRRDVETDGRRAVVAFSTSLSDDAMRRDFTMNALYAKRDGTLVDPVGGLPDIHARRVRFVGRAANRLAEDFLRALRFFRFHAWYGHPDAGMDQDALAAIAMTPERVAALSKERITQELSKLLCAPDPGPAVASMQHVGLLQALLPGADTKALPLLVHFESQMRLDPDPVLRLAALGPHDAVQFLRQSNKESDAYQIRFSEARESRPVAELAYRFGASTTQGIIALRAALTESPPPVDYQNSIALGAHAQFPVAARDLMPDLSGPDLGKALKMLEALWIAEEFRPTRSDLLSRVQGG